MLQVVWFLLAAGLLAAAGTLHGTLDDQSKRYELNPPDVVENYPGKTLMMVAPGGLRALAVNYFWIRAEELKNQGRYYEAMQLSELICKLQPNFAGVWSFHSHNMSWNISVATHTPRERWLWVYNGAKLLRDSGIPLNRKSIILYKDLAWVFYNKMGQYMDEMHMTYKQRWAGMMQRLLASPPYGTTEQTIGAFRPIAEAPLDKDLRRQGRHTIQQDQLEIVLSDPATGRYAQLLEAKGAEIGETLLGVYNRYTNDESVEVIRLAPPKLETEEDAAISALINSTEHAEARKKLLAFLRAQMLWNVYKMDPEWMLKLMEKYGPLDWRLVQPHGLYWSSYGIHVCESKDLADIDSLNTDRNVLNSLKTLTWRGRLTYIENPRDPDYPNVTFGADWRFVEPTQNQHIQMAESAAKAEKREFKDNAFRSGHINFAIQAMQMLYASYRRKEARKLFDWTKENYEPIDPEWDWDVEDFVIYMLNKEGRPIPDRAYGQISSALQAAFFERARGHMAGYISSMTYARRVYDVYQPEAPKRNKLPPFQILARNVLLNMLIRPRVVGINMSLLKRADLYAQLDDRIQRLIYDPISPPLRRQCKLRGIDFEKAFPPPPGLKEYRAKQLTPSG